MPHPWKYGRTWTCAGVFFRDTCRRQAWAHRVSGWVTNREDGAVEAIFEGEAAAVQAMVDWASAEDLLGRT